MSDRPQGILKAYLTNKKTAVLRQSQPSNGTDGNPLTPKFLTLNKEPASGWESLSS